MSMQFVRSTFQRRGFRSLGHSQSDPKTRRESYHVQILELEFRRRSLKPSCTRAPFCDFSLPPELSMLLETPVGSRKSPARFRLFPSSPILRFSMKHIEGLRYWTWQSQVEIRELAISQTQSAVLLEREV